MQSALQGKRTTTIDISYLVRRIVFASRSARKLLFFAANCFGRSPWVRAQLRARHHAQSFINAYNRSNFALKVVTAARRLTCRRFWFSWFGAGVYRQSQQQPEMRSLVKPDSERSGISSPTLFRCSAICTPSTPPSASLRRWLSDHRHDRSCLGEQLRYV